MSNKRFVTRFGWQAGRDWSRGQYTGWDRMGFGRYLRINPNYEASETNLSLPSDFDEGKDLFLQDRYEEALTLFNKCLIAGQKDALLYAATAAALKSLGRYQEALVMCDKALYLRPNQIERFMIYITRLNSLIQLDRYEEALVCVEAYIDMNEDDDMWCCYRYKAEILVGCERPQDALIAIGEAFRLIPPKDKSSPIIMARLFLMRGKALYKCQQYKEALTDISEATYLDPEDAIGYSWKFSVLYKLQRDEEALLAFDKALSLDQGVLGWEDYMDKGDILLGYGKQKEALASYGSALELAPQEQSLRKKLRILLNQCE